MVLTESSVTESPMRILIADKLGSDCEEEFGRIGAACSQLDHSTSTLREALAGHDVLIVRSTRVQRQDFDEADQLGLIVRAGAGTDTIDCAAAAEKGIFVCNVPGKNSVAVAELAMALILALDRRIVEGALCLRDQHWDKAKFQQADGLAGKTLGLIGLGSIGLEVAKRARSFDLNVVAQRKQGRDPEIELAIESTGIALQNSLEEVLAISDIVSVHVPGGKSTNNFIDAKFVETMKQGAMLINTSRGSTMDEAAVLAGLDSGKIRAGLDVFPGEPTASGPFVSRLAQHPSVVGSHHIGASTRQAQRAVLSATVGVVEAFAEGTLVNCVNLESRSRPVASLVVRHADKVGVLAETLQILRQADLNVQEMNNRVFKGADAAVATIELAEVPSQEVLSKIRGLGPVFGVQMQVLR